MSQRLEALKEMQSMFLIAQSLNFGRIRNFRTWQDVFALYLRVFFILIASSLSFSFGSTNGNASHAAMTA